MSRFVLFARCIAEGNSVKFYPSQIPYLRKLVENVCCIYQAGLLYGLNPQER